nr:ribonuclease P protein component [Bacilli bacterium]
MTKPSSTPKFTLKNHRLQHNRDFRQVFVRGKSYANHYFVLYVLKRSRKDPLRIGFSVSKKVGNAVVRNRTKRLLREVVRLSISDLPLNYHLVIIARKDAPKLRKRQDVERHVLSLFKKASLFE